ncbi:MAG TPA: MarR family transcriptional regulator [Acidimicrobiales bacterium]
MVGTADAFMSMANRALRDVGLSAGARHVLAALEGHAGPLTPTEIADRMIQTPASVTSLLDTLARRGLVVREQDPSDRRRVLVSLTPEARGVVDRYLARIVALQSAVTARLTEAERVELVRMLAVIREDIATVDAGDVRGKAQPRRAPRRG